MDACKKIIKNHDFKLVNLHQNQIIFFSFNVYMTKINILKKYKQNNQPFLKKFKNSIFQHASYFGTVLFCLKKSKKKSNFLLDRIILKKKQKGRVQTSKKIEKKEREYKDNAKF